jgi:hypothetical protein
LEDSGTPFERELVTWEKRSSKSPPAVSEGISSFVGSRKSMLALRKVDSISSSMMMGSRAGKAGEEGFSVGPMLRRTLYRSCLKAGEVDATYSLRRVLDPDG